MEADVAIVGGGLLGSAFGWGLASRGARVTIFDEGDDAIRTARGNFGLVWVQGKGRGMPAYARWSIRAAKNWDAFADRLREDTGIDVHYRRPGGFDIALDDSEMAQHVATLEDIRRELSDGEYPYDVLDTAVLRQRLPQAGDVAGATWCPLDGHCNPLKLLRALHSGYADFGGDYRPSTAIARIEPMSGGGFRLFGEHGSAVCDADKVVIAAGHGSPALAETLDITLPLHPDQGQVLVTERSAPVLDVPTSIVRQTDEGTFLLGASSRDAGFDLATRPVTLRDIAQRCVKAFPLLANLRIQRAWAALRIMTPDGFPVYQQSETSPGAWAFACHSGVTLASNHAMDVPTWILDGNLPGAWGDFHPRRFDVSPAG